MATNSGYHYEIYIKWGGIAVGAYEILARAIKLIYHKVKDKKAASDGEIISAERKKAKKEKTKKVIAEAEATRDEAEKMFLDLVEKAKKGTGN